MRVDTYTRILLTIIALCLVVLTIKVGRLEPVARAQTGITCTGELKANAWGGVEASIGGYKIAMTCE